jgi:cytochrome c oxidase subunit 2
MTGYRRRGGAALFGGLAGLAAPAVALASGGAAAPGALANPTDGWNHLWGHVLTDLLVIGTVFSLAAIYMLVKFRAKNPDDVGSGPKLTAAQAIGWALIPAAIFMADDFFLAAKGWVLWNTQRTVPAGALEIRVTGYQWYWEFDYGNGIVIDSRDGESAKVKVPVGKPVVFRMTGADVIHSMFIPEFRVKEDALPGRKTYIWFVAQKPGVTKATCTEFCGINHSQMPAYIEAVAPDAFDTWFKSQGKSASASQNPNS